MGDETRSEDNLWMAGIFLKEATDTHKHLMAHRNTMTLEDRREYIRRCLDHVNRIGRALLDGWDQGNAT